MELAELILQSQGAGISDDDRRSHQTQKQQTLFNWRGRGVQLDIILNYNPATPQRKQLFLP